MLALNFELEDVSQGQEWLSSTLKITSFSKFEPSVSKKHALIIQDDSISSSEYGAHMFFDRKLYQASKLPRKMLLPEEASYLAEGDVFKFNPLDKKARTIYRKRANTNTFLVTENCNSFCLMCSQPPKKKDDSYLLNEIVEVLPFIPKDCPEIGFTGGEPFLKGGAFIEILKKVKIQLPNTSVHILSNGRLFKDINLARQVGALQMNDLMIGIPLYSDLSFVHDFIVQAPKAFTETVKGILNLKKAGVKVEIRYVIHKENSANLLDFSNFILSFLPFVDHVAFMGLEHTGFAKHNIDQLSIDPLDYIEELKLAVLNLAKAKITTSIYNHQLCLECGRKPGHRVA